MYGNEIRENDDENSWSDPEVDDLIRNISEEEVLSCGNDDDHDFQEVQTGRGQKRKNESDQESESEDEQSEGEQGQYYYQMESRRKYHSKKFGMEAVEQDVIITEDVGQDITDQLYDIELPELDDPLFEEAERW